MMSESEFDLDLAELNSAEDFLEYFGIAYDESVVQVNRLHILQRFHDYIDGVDAMPEGDEEKHNLYADLLNSAYGDFVKSNALTEKVFRVFHMHEPTSIEIPLADFKERVRSSAPKI